MTERNTPRLQQVLYHLGRSQGVILQGPPGSGKSQLVSQVIEALCAQGQSDRAVEAPYETFRWSQLARFMESEWLGAPVVWERIQWQPGWRYEHLVRGAAAAAEEPGWGGRGARAEPSRGAPEDRLLLELARVAARREERAQRRDEPCGPTVLVIEDIQRGDVGAALGDVAWGLGSAERGVGMRLRDVATASAEGLITALPASLWLLCTHCPDPGDPTRGLDPHLLRRLRVVDVPADERMLAAHFQDYPDARRAARATWRAVAAAVGDRPELMPGHGYWMVEDGPDWPRLLAEALVYDVAALLRYYRDKGWLRADAVRFESGPDVVTLPLGARHDQWLQVEHLTGWLLRLS
jgi:energy-coupling factor transporter ATP-binding protein EcfA2